MTSPYPTDLSPSMRIVNNVLDTVHRRYDGEDFVISGNGLIANAGVVLLREHDPSNAGYVASGEAFMALSSYLDVRARGGNFTISNFLGVVGLHNLPASQVSPATEALRGQRPSSEVIMGELLLSTMSVVANCEQELAPREMKWQQLGRHKLFEIELGE